MRAKEDIDAVLSTVGEMLDDQDKYPGRSWQQTVYDVLSWAIGDEGAPHPLED